MLSGGKVVVGPLKKNFFVWLPLICSVYHDIWGRKREGNIYIYNQEKANLTPILTQIM